MNPRERKLAIGVGIGIAATFLYFSVNALFIQPMDKAQTAYDRLTKKHNDLDKVIRRESRLARQWNADCARTFSYKSDKAQDLFSQDLKEIARRYGFQNASFKPRTGKRIGRKTKITTQAYRISARGDYEQAINFLRDLYNTPYLCQITSLALTPLGPKADRNAVEMTFTVETPVLPKIKRKDIKLAGRAKTMSDDPEPPSDPFRPDLPPDSNYRVLAQRNIFRSYQPPPSNIIKIDNMDYKEIAIRTTFYWEGRITGEPVVMVAGMNQKPITGKGDEVEITGSYADGEPIGPQRFNFNQRLDWVYKVATHTPPPPATKVILAVNNQDKDEVFITVVITAKDNKTIRPPTMLIDARRAMDLGRWNARQVQVTARYKSGKPAQGGTYLPAAGKQTLLIPPEPAVAVAVTPSGTPVATGDPPPDGRFVVTGLWTYPDAQEMIVSAEGERKIIRDGTAGAVDGGMLLAVHPLGGIVKMPGGNFYIYPLGKSFTNRVLLKARNKAQLAEAIDNWSRLPSSGS